MKFLPSQLAYLLSQRETRRNLKSLAQFVALLLFGIGAKTGLNVIGIQDRNKVVTTAAAGTALADDAELVMIGTSEQRQQFFEQFQ
jgi:hypothetical protein